MKLISLYRGSLRISGNSTSDPSRSLEDWNSMEFRDITFWCNGVLKGNNQKIYAFYLEFKPFHGNRKYVYQFDMIEIEDSKFNNIGRIDWEGWVSEEFEDK